MPFLKTIVAAIICTISLTASAEKVSATDYAVCQDILNKINAYRKIHHRGPLVMNDIISIEAKKHSIEMAKHALPFGHQGFNQRIEHIFKKIPSATAGAENIAFNYKQISVLVDGWTKSPGHKQNILGHYNLTGIGIATDSHGRRYYTQMFIKALP